MPIQRLRDRYGTPKGSATYVNLGVVSFQSTTINRRSTIDNHSYLSASMGLTFVARRAGTKQAASATAVIRSAART